MAAGAQALVFGVVSLFAAMLTEGDMVGCAPELVQPPCTSHASTAQPLEPQLVQGGYTSQSSQNAPQSQLQSEDPQQQSQEAPSAAVAASPGATDAPNKIVIERASGQDTMFNTPNHDSVTEGQTSMYFGNWGTRATNPKQAQQVHANNIAQIIKSPCHIIMLAEANELTLADLKEARVPQSRRHTGFPNFDGRCEQQDGYYAFRGKDENDVLIAVRRSVASDLALLEHNCTLGTYVRDHGKEKLIKVRTLMCEITYKQPIQCIGSAISVAVVHLHYQIAKQVLKTKDVYTAFGR